MLATPALKTNKILEAACKFDDFITAIISKDISVNPEALLQHLYEGNMLYLQLEMWSSSNQEVLASDRWRRSVTLLPSLNDCSFVEYFKSLEAAQYWNQDRCARIHLRKSLLKLATYILRKHDAHLDAYKRQEAEAMMTESSHIIDRLLDDICNSIPFNLRRIDSSGRRCETDRSQRVLGAAGLVWPLEVVLGCEQRSKWHGDLAVSTLREIGYGIGVKQALVVLEEYESRSWLAQDRCGRNVNLKPICRLLRLTGQSIASGNSERSRTWSQENNTDSGQHSVV